MMDIDKIAGAVARSLAEGEILYPEGEEELLIDSASHVQGTDEIVVSCEDGTVIRLKVVAE